MTIATQAGRVPSLEEMADRMAVYDVLTQHSRGVDRADEEILKSCYWPDAEVNYGTFVGKAHEFCEMLPHGIKNFRLTQHCISNVAIQFRGPEASVETYVTALHFGVADVEPLSEMTYIGRYLDKMQKRDDTWKILHRTVLMDWNQTVPTTAIWDGPLFGALKVRGTHHKDDPLYAFLA